MYIRNNTTNTTNTMSNSQSKSLKITKAAEVAQDDNFNGETNTLVLCFEEIDETRIIKSKASNDGSQDDRSQFIDMKCYVMYDKIAHEYFICGQRCPYTKNSHDASEFNFYCKSSKRLVSFLRYVLGSGENKINHILYNCSNMFEVGTDDSHNTDEHYDYVDFDVLENKCGRLNELAGYDMSEFSELESCDSASKLKQLIKMLKHVRY